MWNDETIHTTSWNAINVNLMDELDNVDDSIPSVSPGLRLLAGELEYTYVSESQKEKTWNEV